MLFPGHQSALHHLHWRSFDSWGLAYRELSADELNGAALGWELVWPRSVRVHYLLGADAPYGTPTVRVTAPTEARTRWRHIEKDGTACLLAPGQSWMPLLHPAAIDGVLRAISRIIELNLRRSGDPPDAVAARHRWVDSGVHAWSLLNPERGDSNAVATLLHGRWIIASTRHDLEAWMSHRGMRSEEVVDSVVVHVQDFAEVPRDARSLDGHARRAVEGGGVAVYVVPTEAGPLLVAVALGPSGVLMRVRVDRADRRWLHERGGGGLPAEISEAHVAIVGCGSLGSGVAEILARAGVGRLTLVDPDSLSWDNVARHALGGSAVGRSKASELASRLRAHLPTTPRVVGLPHRWQEVAADRSRALAANLIVGTMAAWPDDLALAEWARARDIPLVLGWLEPSATAGHAISLRGRCLACHFTPRGRFRRAATQWPDESPIRLADGCHEHFLPYGYADVVPIQSSIARLSLEVLTAESAEATHRALLPSLLAVEALGARASRDAADLQGQLPTTVVWAEHRRGWPVDPGCWHCGGIG
ncbi:hypothetical protein KH5H1_37170 [Corallococcus caeni]|uniref:HesA/MoeB/ThiF family protein n=1 Tax=Corallococcus caeni TaxID=3082388 RepID=UPI00295804A7|nr:hypothetical protein KH5H1_37170 [Corallococcus sp. KH5-1]